MNKYLCAIIAFLTAIHFSSLATAAETRIYVAGPIPGFSNPKPIEGRDGLNIDIMRAILDRLGEPYKIDLVPWNRAITMANVGKAAAVFTCSYRKEREQTLIYSEPLRDLTVGILTRKGYFDKPLLSLNDLRNQTVGVTRGFSLQAELEDNGIIVKETKSNTQAIKLLERGRFDFLYVFADISLMILRQQKIDDRFDFYTFRKEPTYICFSKQLPDAESLTKKFNAAMAEVKADGTYEKIANSYWIHRVTISGNGK